MMTNQAQPPGSKDRNLLFGVIAVQMHFISPAEMAKAAAVWAAEPAKGIGDVLVEMNALKPRDREVIETLLDRQIEKHGGNPHETLEAFGGNRAIHESFAASIVVGADDSSPLASFGGTPAPKPAAPTVPPTEPGATQPPPEALDDFARVTLEHPGRYNTLREHGRGGIGRVLVVMDEHIGREVALKELLPERAGGDASSGGTPSRKSSQAAARFVREARITGQLEHPGIVPVYELGRKPDGSIYYTMKLVRGDTLYDGLKAAKSLPERLKLLPHFFDLCQAIAYAHAKGVIHRDLKPHNVMVGKFGETVVLDWGLAKVKGVADVKTDHKIEHELERIKEMGCDAGQTVQGSPIGTPSYMSPEQAEGKIDEIDELSDIWSLGAVLYEILTGEPPFTGDNAYEVLGKVMTQKVKPVLDREPAAPPELRAVCEKCLERDKTKRYSSALEIADDIAEFQSGGLVSAYEYSAWALLGRWVRRRWPVLLTAAAALVAAIILSTGFVLRLKEEKIHATENLAEAYFQYGLRAEETLNFNNARVYYAKALALTGRPDARMALYRESVRPARLLLQSVLEGSDWIQSAAFADNGAITATGGKDKTIMVWSAETGKRLLSLSGHNNTVLALDFSPDGKTLASGGADRLVMLWNAGTGDLVRTLSGHSDAVSCLAYSNDGKMLASGSWDGAIIVWSAAGERIATLTGHQGFISSVAFIGPGNTILSSSGDGSLKLWDPTTGAALKSLTEHKDAVWSAAASPNGAIAASGDLGGVIKLWSLEKEKSTVTIAAHDGAVYGLAFTPDAEFLVSAGAGGEVKVWRGKAGEPVGAVTAHQQAVYALAMSREGKKIITASRDHTARIWAFAGGASARRVSMLAGTIGAISSDGEFAAAPDGESVSLWSLKTGTMLRKTDNFSAFVTAVEFSPDRVSVAGGDAGGKVRICTLVDGACGPELGAFGDEVSSLAYAGDGKTLLGISKKGEVKLWDLPGGAQMAAFQSNQWWGSPRVVIGKDGNLMAVTGISDNLVPVAGNVDGKLKAELKSGHQLRCAAFSPAGATVLTGGCAELKGAECVAGEVILWSLSSAKPVRTFSGHAGLVTAVAFSPDNSYLVSGGADGTVILWSPLDSGPLMIMNSLGAPITSLIVSQDGETIIARAENGETGLWPLRREIFKAPGPGLFQEAQQETGLRLEGFGLSLR